MSTVYSEASMSLDGYIAGPAESGFEQLFQWYGNGDVPAVLDDPKVIEGDRVTHLYYRVRR